MAGGWGEGETAEAGGGTLAAPSRWSPTAEPVGAAGRALGAEGEGAAMAGAASTRAGPRTRAGARGPRTGAAKGTGRSAGGGARAWLATPEGGGGDLWAPEAAPGCSGGREGGVEPKSANSAEAAFGWGTGLAVSARDPGGCRGLQSGAGAILCSEKPAGVAAAGGGGAMVCSEGPGAARQVGGGCATRDGPAAGFWQRDEEWPRRLQLKQKEGRFW